MANDTATEEPDTLEKLRADFNSLQAEVKALKIQTAPLINGHNYDTTTPIPANSMAARPPAPWPVTLPVPPPEPPKS